MKKLLILTSLTLTTLTAAATDIVNPQPINQFNITSYIPADYTSNRKPALTFYSSGEITVYGPDMQQSGTVTLPPADTSTDCGRGFEWRDFITSWSTETKTLMADDITLAEADYYIELDAKYSTLNSFPDGKGATIFISDAEANVHQWLYRSWGEFSVPSIIIPSGWYVFTPKSATTGSLHKITGSGTPSFKILPELHTAMLERYGGNDIAPIIPMQSISYDHGAATAATHLTQTLFNSDPAYEYLRPLTEIVKQGADYFCLPGTEYPDGVVGQYIAYTQKIAGFEICSDSGASLQSVRFPEATYMSYPHTGTILSIGGYTYLKFTVDSSLDLLYRVESSSSASVKSVGAPIPVTIHPTELTRGQMLNVHSQTDARLSVYDLNGRRIYTAPVPAGTATEIPTTGFTDGINIVNVTTPANTSTTTKVIVR